MKWQEMLEVQNVVKSYGSVAALRGVSLRVEPGEVRALLGSNGAGKSTLIKILSGVESPDGGSVIVDGVVRDFASARDASDAGVRTVFQEFSLVPGLSVAENIMMGEWQTRPSRGPLRFINSAALRQRARESLELMNANIDVNLEVHRLSLGQRQVVEIAKALRTRPGTLILDEPTSALSREDADFLIALVRRLAATGISVIYVSHRMDEIPRVADTLSVLRDGLIVETRSVPDTGLEEIAQLMIGHKREPDLKLIAAVPSDAPVRLSVRNLSRAGSFQGVNLDVRAGEVVGLAGLMGSGRSEILRAIFGRDRASGEIWIDGQRMGRHSERAAIAVGLALTPEDRKHQGLVMMRSVRENLTMAAFSRFVSAGLVSSRRENSIARSTVESLDIKAATIEVEVGHLSGGNQQKVVLGKWLAAQAEIFLLDEPTRGVDIHAKDQIYRLIRELSRQGKSVVFVSSEESELFEVCHRIAVLRNGRLVRSLDTSSTNELEILTIASKDEGNTE